MSRTQLRDNDISFEHEHDVFVGELPEDEGVLAIVERLLSAVAALTVLVEQNGAGALGALARLVAKVERLRDKVADPF